MSSVPPGVLSFLYNVMHDVETNDAFRLDPYEVMEFFKLTDVQRKIVYEGGEDLVELRDKKERKRKALIRKRKEERDEEYGQGSDEEYDYEYIYIKADELQANYVTEKEVSQLVRKKRPLDNADLDALLAQIDKELKGYDERHVKQLKVLVGAVVLELLGGYGRFW